ncbi:hypothetical protein LINPERHAP1_LOCUS3740 [Linum perenne]
MVFSYSSCQLSSKITWIIDSGASDHVVCSASLLYSCKAVTSLSVTLPNGNRVPVSHIGSVKITDEIIVHDVLVISGFSFNLLSVSKLTSQLHCRVVFSPKSCLFQDQLTSLTIGTAKLLGGLYVF